MRKLLVSELKFYVHRQDAGKLPDLLGYLQCGSGPNEHVALVLSDTVHSNLMTVSVGAWENPHLKKEMYGSSEEQE